MEGLTAMAAMMKAWRLRTLGLRNLELAETPIPATGEQELLVRVRAVSLNYRDKLVAEGGLLPAHPPMPFVPASDMAGDIVAVGSAVRRFRIGDRVSGNFWTQWIDGEPPTVMKQHGLSLGGPLPGVLAEYIVLPESVAVMAPSSLSDVEAATLPVAGLTAWFALIETGLLAAGQVVLVQGTGGVAMFGMQFAQALGARAIVTSRDATKVARLRALGISDVIDTSRTPDWSTRVMELTDDHGVDHILELIGGDNLRQSAEALASGGRIAQIGFLRGSDINLPAVPLMLRRAIIQGISVGHRRAFEDMNRAIDTHGVKPIIDKVYAFADAPAAFAHLERGPFGKVVVDVSG